MLLPVFASCPTMLNESQDKVRRLILGEMGHAGIELRALGRTDYPAKAPMTEILMLARRCSGGVIFGFSQFETDKGTWKRGTPDEKRQKGAIAFPTPWNHLEAAVLYALRMPLLVFREVQVTGGIFDKGVTDLFIHEMPLPTLTKPKRTALREVIRKFSAEVQTRYYLDS